MFAKHHAQSGFTMVELLVVVTFIVLIATFAMSGFQNYASYQQYNQAVGDVAFTVQQTRLNARSAVADEAHGIKILSDSLTQFVGTTYILGAPTNVVTTYPLVTFQPELAGGVDEIVFAKLTGLPSATGTIVTTGTSFSASTSLIISDTGVIQ